MMTSHFYFEHTQNHDTSVWVQWLDDNGNPVDVTKWNATLDIDQGPTKTALVIPQIIRSKESAAFRFDIQHTEAVELGLFAAKVNVIDFDTSSDMRVIARGAINILSEGPI